MLCVSLKAKTNKELVELFSQIDPSIQLVEIRVDYLESIDDQVLSQCIQKLPCILTLRSEREGGFFKGDLDEHIQIVKNLAKLQPAYVDVEHHLPKELFVELAKQNTTKVIASYHALNSTPDNLDSILEELKRKSAALYKFVTKANQTLDALRMLHFSRKAGKQVLAFAMGTFGSVTRILGPVVDNAWTYCSLKEGFETAEGQLTADELENIYKYSSLSSKTTLCGLIGNPVTFSIGEIAHNAVYKQLGIDAVYVKLHITREELGACLCYLESLRFRGLSITIPYKEVIRKYLKHVDLFAHAIGAVNTITYDEQGSFGCNTDAVGALDAIESHKKVKGLKLVILGAGGSSRSIAYESKKRGALVTVVARRKEQADEVARELGVVVCDYSSMPKEYDVLVNATPSELPIREDYILPHSINMDLKSKPKETKLLKIAKERGANVVYGIEMYNRQAVKQVQAWFPEYSEIDLLKAFSN